MIWGETPLFLETPILVLRDKFLNLNVSGILGWNSEILLLFTTIWGMFFRREKVVTRVNIACVLGHSVKLPKEKKHTPGLS